MTSNSVTPPQWLESAEAVIRARRSTRGFASTPVTSNQKAALLRALNTGRNPFRANHRFKIVTTEDTLNTDTSSKLGTYGVIKGARHYLISAMTPGDESLEALGFDMEYAVLEAQSLGLGTCWLGGTFNKGQFAKALGLSSGEMLPIVIPFGYPSDKDGFVGRLIRSVAGSDQRLDFEALFSHETYGTPLKKQEGGTTTEGGTTDPEGGTTDPEGGTLTSALATALEMIRLGPSASNKQPWRVVKEGKALHFYLRPTKGYSKSLGYDIQRVDMGIALCHFDVMVQAQGIKGHYEKHQERLNQHNLSENEKRDDLNYIISFILE